MLSFVVYKYFFVYALMLGPVFYSRDKAILMMNMAGLPPLSGFFLKVEVLQQIGM